MISANGSSWFPLIDQLTAWIVKFYDQHTLGREPDRLFFLIFQLFHVFSALIRDEDSAFVYIEWSNPFSIDNLNELRYKIGGAGRHLESICTALHNLARLNSR